MKIVQEKKCDEKCEYFIKCFNDKEKYSKTILIICKLRRNDFYSKCPLLKKIEFPFLEE
jgi:hypothetical protein